MVTKPILGLLLILTAVPMAYASMPPSLLEGCVTSDSSDERVRQCHATLMTNYERLFTGWLYELDRNDELQDKLTNNTAHYKAEVHVWQTKYAHLLAQQGGTSIQDQVANLTDRVTAVETKAATNESLIYIIQNMLRTVQTDIADIFLKINSVR